MVTLHRIAVISFTNAGGTNSLWWERTQKLKKNEDRTLQRFFSFQCVFPVQEEARQFFFSFSLFGWRPCRCNTGRETCGLDELSSKRINILRIYISIQLVYISWERWWDLCRLCAPRQSTFLSCPQRLHACIFLSTSATYSIFIDSYFCTLNYSMVARRGMATEKQRKFSCILFFLYWI